MKISDVLNLGVDSNGVPYIIDQPDGSDQPIGTVLCANLFNPLLAEIYNAIKLSGLQPSSDNTQLYQVLAKINNDIANIQGGGDNINKLAAQIAQLTNNINQISNQFNNSGISDAVSKVNDLKNQLLNLPGVNIKNATTSTLDDYDDLYKLNSKFMIAIRLVQRQLYGFIRQRISQVSQIIGPAIVSGNGYPNASIHSSSYIKSGSGSNTQEYGGILQSDVGTVTGNTFLQCQRTNGEAVGVIGVTDENGQSHIWVFNPKDGTITTPTGKVIGN